MQVPLGDGDVDRLADHGTGVLQGRRHVGQLVEVVQVLDRAVATLAVEAAHEGRAVGRPEHHRVAADLGRLRRVAGVEREALGCLRDEAHEQLARNPDAGAVDLGPGLGPDGERLVLAEVDADLLEHAHGGVVDPVELLGAEDLVERQPALQGRERADRHRGAHRAPCLATTPPAFGHVGPPRRRTGRGLTSGRQAG